VKNSPTRRSPFPLQQGDLDFLCSIYAAINAMAWRGEVSTLDEAAAPFKKAIDFIQAEKGWNLAASVCLGIDEDHYAELLTKLNWRPRREPARNPSIDELETALSATRAGVSPCAIISLIHPEDVGRPYHQREAIHYTVATAVTSDSILLQDSAGTLAITREGDKWLYGLKGNKRKPVRFGCLYS
jgi:hypothetical protein